MTPLVTAGAAFLVAVLWFDLMFDIQVRGTRAGDVPEDVLASISAYYRRVTTTARPMNRLVAAVMLGTVAAIGVQLARGDASTGVGVTSLCLAGVPIVLAGAHTVPAAVRLGAGTDTLEQQSRAAKSIFRDHLICLASIASLLAVQLVLAR